MFFVKKIDSILTLGYIITQFSVAIIASFIVKACSKANQAIDPPLTLNMLYYTILESIACWFFVLAFLKASEKGTGELEGSILVAGAALVGF